MNTRKSIIKYVLLIAVVMVLMSVATAQAVTIPTLNIGVENTDSPEQTATVIQVLFVLTVLALAPAILVMMTSFTRLLVVLSFLRHAMGTQSMPPNQIIVGLALFLTFFIMTPVWNQIDEKAYKPYMANEITQEEALNIAAVPISDFMFQQTREKDLALFMKIADNKRPVNKDDVPLSSLVPAFIISELKTAFTIGFILYVPFLIIDMVVASVLLSMGMMMLPPIMISLPFKLMLFVLVDGWNLLIGSLVNSFG